MRSVKTYKDGAFDVIPALDELPELLNTATSVFRSLGIKTNSESWTCLEIGATKMKNSKKKFTIY
jgi:hypothetical protein